MYSEHTVLPSAHKDVQSYPSACSAHSSLEPRLSFMGGKKSLVHTVCACVKIPRNPGNLDSSIKYHVYYSVH